ncbi:MAG: hypothetical protein AB1298_08180 [Bacteroidota bacterium]
MAKSLFKNYTYQFDSNEKKVLTTFCKTILKQMAADERFYQDVRSFNSIVDKLNGNANEVKFTKEEKTKLIFNLNNNISELKKRAGKGFFFIRWFYKSAYKQYNNILQKHFTN